MGKLKEYADALERTAWTAAEGAGGVGVVAAYQSLPISNIPEGWLVPVTVAVSALLAAGKGIIATKVGNGTASTLPPGLEPTPAPAVYEARRARDDDGDGEPDVAP